MCSKNKVYSVSKGSIAEEAGIEAGDLLISINGQPIKDIFDYRFFCTNEELVAEVEKPSGEVWEIEIDKDENEDLGIEFEDSLIDGAKSCTNKCIFCFIDQLPKGMRETVYFKDDDSRLSFLTGNYVTLTNINNEDLNRIIRYRMSPINVSVHTTNPELRKKMLNNRFAGDVLNKIKLLTDAGIEVNCQIVLCRGVNDKDQLDNTIGDLARLYPDMRSISVVPVGITKYREGLFELTPFDRQSCIEVIKQVEKWQDRLLKETGSRIVYLSDEFYINAGYELPDYEHYEDFPQIENGVGLVASLKQEVQQVLKRKKKLKYEDKRIISIATGRLVYENILKLVNEIKMVYDVMDVNVFPIENNFFGPLVTVSGLITGQDIVSQLKGKVLGERLLITKSMLRSGETVFLDDYTVEKVEKELNVKVRIVDNDGKDFVNAVIGK